MINVGVCDLCINKGDYHVCQQCSYGYSNFKYSPEVKEQSIISKTIDIAYHQLTGLRIDQELGEYEHSIVKYKDVKKKMERLRQDGV